VLDEILVLVAPVLLGDGAQVARYARHDELASALAAAGLDRADEVSVH
jgi:hypothetical protein